MEIGVTANNFGTAASEATVQDLSRRLVNVQ